MFSEMVIPEEITRPDVKRWIDRVESFDMKNKGTV